MRKWLMTFLLVSGLLAGCSGIKRTVGSGQVPKKGQLSKVELRDELDRFEYIFITAMKQAASDIEAAAETRRIQRTNVQMQTRLIEALHAMMASDDSVVCFFDTWALILRLRMYLEQGDGSTLYGDLQPAAIAFIRLAELEIDRIGQLFLKPDQFEDVRRKLEVFSHQYPITGTYSNLVVFATQEKKAEAGALIKTLSIPMAPIRAMEGVDKTGDAILKIRDSVDRFTDVTEQIPESTRWQMSILIDDFEESEMTQKFLKSLTDFSQSSARLVEVLNAMPQQLKTELRTVLEESEQTQQQFQTTLKTTAEAAGQIEKTFGEVRNAAGAVNATASQAKDAAIAWQQASDSIQNLVMLFKTETPRAPDAPPPFGMHDFDAMLSTAGQTADKVAAAVAQLHQVIESGKDTGIHREVQAVVDHITIRLFLLILSVFILSGIYHYVRKKLV